MIARQVVFLSATMLSAALIPQGASQTADQRQARTRVVLLGTGTPVPDPDSSGPATAIVVGERTYLVDFGPGVVRRAELAVLDKGVTALEPANLNVAFLTPSIPITRRDIPI